MQDRVEIVGFSAGAVLEDRIHAGTARLGFRVDQEDGTGTWSHVPASEPEQIASLDNTVAGTALPGFVDIQVNGAGGHSVDECSVEALDAIARAVWSGGAVAYLPTLITNTMDAMAEQAAEVARWIAQRAAHGPSAEHGAMPLGIHLEGPFLEVPGTHPEEQFLDPTLDRVERLVEACRGQLAMVTLACGRAGAAAATAALVKRGVTVAIGHAQTTDGLFDCIQAGASSVTHLFNAMGPIHHRDPGLAGFALEEPLLACPVIADGAHVHPTMLRHAFRIAGINRTILVTDAVSAAGQPDGEFFLSGIPVTSEDGVVRNAAGALAGSALTMSRAAENWLGMVPESGLWSLGRIASTNPARLLGARGEAYGSLHRGSAVCTVRRADGTFAAMNVAIDGRG